MALSRRVWLGAAVALAHLSLFAAPGEARSVSGVHGARRTSGTRSSGPRRPFKYYVLQVMGAGGQVTFEVCGDTELQARMKSYDEEFEAAAKEWLKAKAEAKKANAAFTEEKPKGPRLMQRMSQVFLKEEEARAYAEKAQERWNEALEKKLAKKAPEPAERTEDKPKE